MADWPNLTTLPAGHAVTAGEWAALVDAVNNKITYARKTVDESVTSSTVLQADDELRWAVVANAVYELDLDVIHNNNGTPDTKIGWTVPAGTTMTWEIVGDDTAGGVVVTAGLTQASTVAIGGIGADARLSIRGIVVVGATAGTAQMTWAQNTSSASASTVRAGSAGRLTRIS